MSLYKNWMNPSSRLFYIKLLHTIIWLFFVVIIFYVLYSGVANNITIYTWISIGFVIGEGLTLLIFRMYCPLTLLAKRYSDSEKENFDIFLPNWLAKYNKVIFTTIFVVGLLIVLFRALFNELSL